MELKKTLKLKLIPLTKRDKVETLQFFKEYRSLVSEALNIIVSSDARSKKKAHELCYRALREKHPHLHNKFVEEAYKRALAMYKSYRKLLRKWERGKLRSKPTPPSVRELRVIDLHIDTFRVEQDGNYYLLRVSKGSGSHVKFVVMMYRYALEQLRGARVGNSKLLVDEDELFLLLTITKEIETRDAKNRIYIDTNEDNVSVLLVNYDEVTAKLFRISYDVSRIRTRYRCIRRSIQRKVENPYIRNRLLSKYGARERNRVEDRLKRVAHVLGDIAEENNAVLVRERLRDLKNGEKSRSKRLNYRLGAFPYRKFFTYLDAEFAERGFRIEEVDARNTSITCPVCGYVDKRNRVNSKLFRCRKCGLTYNVHYIACLNLLSRHNDGSVAISGGRVVIKPCEAGPVVPVYEAPNDPAKSERVPREKPVPRKTIVTKIIKRA